MRLLKDHDVTFKHLIHEVTPTSQDSAAMRGTSLESGVKSIILRGKSSKKNYQVNIPAHLKLDMKAVSQAVGEKCEFEEAQVIKERFGLVIGGVPPFGQLLNVDNFFDEQLANNEQAAFNCGLPTESIFMQAKDLVAIVQPKLGLFSKE